MKYWLVALLFVVCCPLPVVRAAPTIVLLGDSLAHGAGDERGLGLGGNLARELGVHVVNAAVNGSRTWNLDAILARREVATAVRGADAIVVSIGGNDLFGDRRAQLLAALVPRLMMEMTLDRMAVIVGRLHALNGRARVIVLGLYNPYRGTDAGRKLEPLVGVWQSKLFARFADDRRVTVLAIADLFARRNRLSPIDHFHPSGEGYALIARRIAEGW